MEVQKRQTLVALGSAALAALLFFWSRPRPRASFAGQVVLITGGSRGLGLALAREFAQTGAILALVARDEKELESAAAVLRQESPQTSITVWVCDLLTPSQIEQVIDKIRIRHGFINVLVNNAGEIVVGPLRNMRQADFARGMQLHFWAPFHLIQAVLPLMQAQGGGRIVNISSIGGKIAVPHLAPYSTSKFAEVGLSDAVGAELFGSKIGVTTVVPGLLRTGSHVNAHFKGAHSREFTWFSLGMSLPLISTSAKAAARQIVAGCYRKDAYVIIGTPARSAMIFQALFPNLMASVTRLIGGLLPNDPSSAKASQRQTGWNSRSNVSQWFTFLADHATRRLNGEIASRRRLR